MGSIKVCDRCGKRILDAKQGWLRSFVYYGRAILCYDMKPEEENFDLCPDCLRSFEDWMEVGKDDPD